jgi:hypothetical protein
MMVFIVTLVFIVCWAPYHIVRYTNAIKMKGYMLYREFTCNWSHLDQGSH